VMRRGVAACTAVVFLCGAVLHCCTTVVLCCVVLHYFAAAVHTALLHWCCGMVASSTALCGVA
jgi:hypothetical protein